jgi:hypothetical protein
MKSRGWIIHNKYLLLNFIFIIRMVLSKNGVHMLHNILLALTVLVFSQNIFAQKVGIALGTSQMTVEGLSGEPQSEGGLLGGALFYNKFSDTMMQRIGVLYTQRDFSYTIWDGSTTKVSLSYLQVPLTMGFIFNPNFAFFGGVALNLNVGKSCAIENSSASCTPKGVKSADLSLNLGVNLTFIDDFGLEIFYDKAMGKIMDNTTGASTVGVSLLYLIE